MQGKKVSLSNKKIALNPKLPKYESVNKLLKNLNGKKNRTAVYKACVTIMMPNGEYIQEFGESKGTIATKIIGKLERPYFYSIFVLDGTNVAFNELEGKELDNTYRYIAIKKALTKFLIMNKQKRNSNSKV